MNKIVFLHIPKTAGSTFRKQILDYEYKPNQCFHVIGETTIDDFYNLDTLSKSSVKVLTGHIPFRYNTYFNEDDNFIAFVRDPAERAVSQYLYIKRNTNLDLNKEIIKADLAIKEFALSNLTDELDNGQTRQLSGINTPINQVNEQMLNIAKENILKYISIGITERFDESVVFLYEKHQWSKYKYYCKQNVSKNKIYIDDETKKMIEERNKYDVELYKWCVDLFEKEISDIPCFQSKLKKYKIKNTIHSIFYCEIYLFMKKALRKIKKELTNKQTNKQINK